MKPIAHLLSLTVATALLVTGAAEILPVNTGLGIESADAQFAARSRRPKSDNKNKPKTKSAPTMSENAFKKIDAARICLDVEDYQCTIDLMSNFLGSKRWSQHERATANQLIAFAYATMAGKEKAADRSNPLYRQAVTYFKAAIDTGGFTRQVMISTVLNLGQMFMILEDWDGAAYQIELWFDLNEADEKWVPKAQPYMMLAQVYYSQGRSSAAIPLIEDAISLKRTPSKSWYQFLVALHLEPQDYDSAMPVLEKMVLLFPEDKISYQQLAAIYSEKGMDEKSLAIHEIVYARGMISKDTECRQLAQLFAYHELPYKAAVALEGCIKNEISEASEQNLEMVGNNWTRAREYAKSIDPLTQAAKLSETGEIYLRLGRSYFETQEWQKSRDALANAISKGGLKDSDLGNAHFLTGISAYYQEDTRAALRAFSKARGYKATTKSAQSWVNYLGQVAALQ